jgi:hypothetical protein
MRISYLDLTVLRDERLLELAEGWTELGDTNLSYMVTNLIAFSSEGVLTIIDLSLVYLLQGDSFDTSLSCWMSTFFLS